MQHSFCFPVSLILFFRIQVDSESHAKANPYIWFNAVAEPANRRIVAATLEFLENLEKLSYRNGKTSIEILENNKLGAQRITFQMPSYSPFWKIFNERIQSLLEAGMCPHRLADHILSERSMNTRFDEEIPPLVLSMDDLGVGFGVCLIPLALSVSVFVFEVAYSKVKLFLKECSVLFVIFVFVRTCKPGI